VLDPAIHDVFAGSAIASVVMLVALVVVPRRTDLESDA